EPATGVLLRALYTIFIEPTQYQYCAILQLMTGIFLLLFPAAAEEGGKGSGQILGKSGTLFLTVYPKNVRNGFITPATSIITKQPTYKFTSTFTPPLNGS
ncbi:4925_t:CDS:2, partial [Funneliformis geosporum]